LANSGTILQELREKEEKMYGYFLQGCAMSHTANFGTASVKEVFSEYSITNRLWRPISSDPNPRNYNM
jgi:hypothetical protein